MADHKALRKKYGVTMAPVPCTRAYKKPMRFDHKKVHTEAFILINDSATTLPDGKPTAGSRTHINLYDRETGIGYDANKATYELGDEKRLKRVLKDYVECPISDCSVAIPLSEVSNGE